MTVQKFDILISGAGVAGLVAAASFGAKGFHVLCCDPMPPVTVSSDPKSDLRTTAFLQPARDLLTDVGLWSRFAPFATPLEIMRIIDAGGEDGSIRKIKDFTSHDIGAEAFGWNLPNWLLRREIIAQIETLENVELRTGVGVRGMLTRTSEARVTLSDESRISAHMVIGADGRTSAVRDAAGIGAKTTKFGQHAITCAVTHDAPHDNISTEIHRSGGPFTLVPLPDYDGKPCSALVWMDRSAAIDDFMALSDAAFEAAMLDRSAGAYGPLSLVSRRTSWPIISQLADRFSAERTALIAEAAHVVPPIGAQGLNMSLGDIRDLLMLSMQHKETLGNAAMLDAYQKARFSTVRTRVEGIKMLNRASMSDTQMFKNLRAFGLEALHEITPIRRGLMQMGMGGSKNG